MANYLVVGGSTGIGFSLVSQLTASGHHVTVLSRTNEALSNLTNVTHIPYDVTNPTEVSLPDALEGFAYCPGTINLKPFHRLKAEDFNYDFQVNLVGGVVTLQNCLPALKRGLHPSILFFSTVAVRQGTGFHASVAASKGAVEGLTRSLAAELAPKIRVNCIAPSVTDTPLATRLLSSDDKKEASAKRHPLNKVGTPRDIAKFAGYLLSLDAGWITGQVMHIDGGLSTLRSI